MSLTYDYFHFNENTDKKTIQNKINKYEKKLNNDIHFFDDIICKNDEEAEVFLSKHTLSYSHMAVKVQKPTKYFLTPELLELRNKVESFYFKILRLDRKPFFKNPKEKFAVCSKCGSNINTAYLEYYRLNKCPVCHYDIRPETFHKKIMKLKEQEMKANAEFLESKKEFEASEQKGIMWLVRIELTYQ